MSIVEPTRIDGKYVGKLAYSLTVSADMHASTRQNGRSAHRGGHRSLLPKRIIGHIWKVKIILLGYMGSGKSTLGKKLARELSVPFYDLDKLIAEKEGRSVSELFALHGEAYFRELEQKMLRDTLSIQGSWVLSVGGGTPCFFDNMKVMNEVGMTVFIHMPVGALAERLRHAKEKRPLLEQVAPDLLENHIAQHMQERIPFYSQAKYTIEGLSVKVQDVLLLLGHGAA